MEVINLSKNTTSTAKTPSIFHVVGKDEKAALTAEEILEGMKKPEAIYSQPAGSRDWPIEEAKTLLLRAFLKFFRLVGGSKAHVIELESGKEWTIAESEFLLAKTWAGTEKKGTGKKAMVVQSEFSLRSCLKDAPTSLTFVAPIQSYSYPAKALVKAKARPDSDIIEPCYNTRMPLALEGADFDAKALQARERETLLAENILKLIESRFDKTDNPREKAAYYCCYVCDMISKPAQPPKTCLGFFNSTGGTGKTTLGYMIPAFLLGKSHAWIGDLQENRFARGYEDKILVHFSEISKTNTALADMMKRLVDTRVQSVERKGKDPILVETCVRLTAASNFPERFRLDDKDDRRWTVFNLPYPLNQQELDLANFLSVLAEGSSGELEAIEAGENPTRGAISIDLLRLRIFQKLEAFYKAYEEESGNPINLRRSLKSKAKLEIASLGAGKNPIIRLAVDLLTTFNYCGKREFDGQDVTKHRTFMKAIATKGQLECRSTDWTGKYIDLTLQKSGYFEKKTDAQERTFWELSDSGIEAFLMSDEEALKEYLGHIKGKGWSNERRQKWAAYCEEGTIEEALNDFV